MPITAAADVASASPSRGPAGSLNAAVAWGVALAAVWLWTWHHLSLAWSALPNYQYGFAVPLLSLYLARHRFASETESFVASNRWFLQPGVFLAIALLAWSGFTFAELLRRIDPLWRPISFLMMSAATLLTVGWVLRIGGGKLLRALAFPLAFTWTAVPWPTFLETLVTKGLKHFVTAVDVGILNATGVLAFQRANVIDLVGSTVVVDGACSGVNSLQSSIMVTLFLGELFRFRAARRLWLIAAGVVIAIFGNLVRTYLLARLVHIFGEDAIATYHDRLGDAAIITIYLAIIGLAWLMARKTGLPPARDGVAQAGCLLAAARLSPAGAAVALVAFLSVPGLASLWFAVSPGGQIQAQDNALWDLRERQAPARWEVAVVELSRTEREALRFSEGHALRVTMPQGVTGTLFHFFWRPDETHVSLFYDHTPDTCMPGAGWQLTGSPTTVDLRIGGQDIPSRLFHFHREDGDTVAIQTIWNGGSPGLLKRLESSEERAARLALLWKGPRLRGMEVLTAFVSGVQDDEGSIHVAEGMWEHLLAPSSAVGKR